MNLFLLSQFKIIYFIIRNVFFFELFYQMHFINNRQFQCQSITQLRVCYRFFLRINFVFVFFDKFFRYLKFECLSCVKNEYEILDIRRVY